MNRLPILTILIALPLAGALGCLWAGRRARELALLVSVLLLGLTILIWGSLPAGGGFAWMEWHTNWAPSLGIEYRLGVDGLSALLLALAALVTLLAIEAAEGVRHQPGLFFALVLTLEAGLFGSFTALNFYPWFLFWELSLIPAFFLIKLWGGAGRGAAATQFFLYTMAGSAVLLLCFAGIFVATGSMDFLHLAAMGGRGDLGPAIALHLGPCSQLLAIGLVAAFGVKAAMAPFHTWLPAAYAEAPTSVTILLTGAMSKLGLYGLLRLALPLFGSELARLRPWLLGLAVLTVLTGAFAAVVQKDMKRLFAYLSVNHIGYCLLGIFSLARPATDAVTLGHQTAALSGVLLQIFNHGLTAAALFWFVARLQARTRGPRGVDSFGGLRRPAPRFAALMSVALFAALGLPGLNGFVSEFLIFRGSFPLAWQATSLCALGLLASSAVILTLIYKVFDGPVAAHCEGFADLRAGETMAIAPALGLMLLLGLMPQWIVETLNPTVVSLLAQWRF